MSTEIINGKQYTKLNQPFNVKAKAINDDNPYFMYKDTIYKKISDNHAMRISDSDIIDLEDFYDTNGPQYVHKLELNTNGGKKRSKRTRKNGKKSKRRSKKARRSRRIRSR